MRRPINLSGTPATDVANDQLNGSTNCEIGAVALSENIHAAIHANRTRAWSVAHDDRAHWHRGCEHTMNVESVIAYSFKTCNDPWQVLGFTTSHHRIDRHFFNGDLYEVGRNNCHNISWLASSSGEHAHHPLFGRRNNRKAISPTAIKHGFKFVFCFSDVNTPCRKSRCAKTNTQFVNQIRVNTQ